MKEAVMITGKRLCPFILKLWRIMNDHSLHSIIHWSAQGSIICIVNSKLFCESVLPLYFKHNNWQSFVRQLNLYGFRKVSHFNISTDYIHARQEIVWQFKHLHFQQHQSETLVLIQRKISSCALRLDSDKQLEAALPNVIRQLERTERQNAELRKETQWLRQQQEKQQHMTAMLLERASAMTRNLQLSRSSLNGKMSSVHFNYHNDRDSDTNSSSNNGNNNGMSKSRISLPPLTTLLKK